RGGDADRGVDVVDVAARFDDPGDVHRLVDRGATLDQLVAADAHAECEAVANDTTHGGHDLQEHPGPVRQRPAVVVGALVRRRGEEAAHDGAVAALQLDAV